MSDVTIIVPEDHKEGSDAAFWDVVLGDDADVTTFLDDASSVRKTLKHQPGKHDQRTHTPKAYLGASSDMKALADPNSKINQDAVKNWKNLSHEERMALASPDVINLRMEEQLDRYRKEYDAPHDLTGKELTNKAYSQVADNAHAHIDSLRDAMNPTTERMLHDYVDTYMKDAVAQSIKEGSIKIDAGELDSLMRRNIDKLTFQEIESRKRQLGDHGIRHVVGNVQATYMMLNDTDLGSVSGMDKLMAMQTMVDHDMGYTAGIATKSFEATKYHELFSEQYAKSEGYDKLFGDRTAEMHNWVKTHAEIDIDWKNQPVLSAIRTADNTALFAKEKYPALFNDVPGANDELYKLQLSQVAGTANETLPSVKNNLRNLVDKSDLDPRQKEDLRMAVGEVFPQSGKFTLGMGAGEVDGYDYKDGIMHIRVTGKPEKEALDGVFDLGQRQFDKLVGEYEHEGSPSTGWKLKDADGKAVIQIDYSETKAPVSGSLGRLYSESVRPDIKQASRMAGTSSKLSDRERIWPAIEANVKAKMTSSEMAEFERRFKAGTLDEMPLTSKERAFLTEEVVKMLKMLLGEEEALKHLPGRHDQQRHAGSRGVAGSGELQAYAKPEDFNQMTEDELRWSFGRTGEPYLRDKRGFLVQGKLTSPDELPDKLYHVTTNVSAVQESGKLRGFAGLESGGLGGGSTEGVSLTSSLEDARLIEGQMRRTIEFAKSDKPLESALNEWAREDEQRAGLSEGRLDRAVSNAMLFYEANAKSLVYSESEENLKSLRLEAARNYRSSAQFDGGPDDVIIISTDHSTYANLDPNNLGIFEIPKQAAFESGGAVVSHAAPGDFLHEVRVYGDVPIVEANILED